MNRSATLFALAMVLVSAMAVTSPAHAVKSEVYGFVMTDIRYDAEAKDPAWFDVMRPTKLPVVDNGFGESGNTSFSVRQTRFGIKSFIPTDMGELKTQFEWELFGTGVDAGQTTLRLRHAYGELGQFGAGQTWSPFMDIDVFPNSIEYWGPSGMAFFRNVQARWMPKQGDSRITIAIERPGASADQGEYSDRVDFSDVVPRFPLPDVSAEWRHAGNWGYVELAGIAREIAWDDLDPSGPDLSDEVLGWGLHASSNIKFSNSVIRLSVLHGEGIQNYMNDAPEDIGTEPDDDNPGFPKGVAIPVTGVVAFLDHNWNTKWATSIGYSMVDIDNTEGQLPSAFKHGDYALVNALYTPVPNLMLGPELQWIQRENKGGGDKTDNVAVQFSFKYSFSSMIGGD
jgi:hypothetical protein